MIIFTKYSNDRDRTLRIRTDILEEEGVLRVRKSAAHPAAADHIRGIIRHGKALSEFLAGTGFVPNACAEEDGAAVFPYLEGPTLEELCDGCLRVGEEKLKELLFGYLSDLMNMSDTAFSETEGFRAVFGPAPAALTGLPSLSAADIDLVLNNIIVQGEVRHIIDYEWTFDFPVPALYIVWRVLHYYLTGNSNRLHLDADAYLSEAGISASLSGVFREMEEHFQSYVSGDTVPRRDLYPDISDGYTDVYALVRNYEGARISSVYTDGGSGYSEDTRHSVRAGLDGRVRMEVPVSGCRRVRIDPLETPCFAEFREISFDGTPADLTRIQANGTRIGDGAFYFAETDPQIELAVPPGAGSMKLSLSVKPLDKCDPEILSRGNAALSEETAGLRGMLKAREDLLAHRLALADEIAGMRSVKALRKVERLRGRDPFAGFHPDLDSDPSAFCANSDAVRNLPAGLLITGWCFDRAFGTEEIRVTDAAGRPLPETDGASVRVTRSARPDVNAQFGLPGSRICGFSVFIPEGCFGDGRLILLIENLRGRWRREYAAETDHGRRMALVRRGQESVSAGDYAEWARGRERLLRAPELPEEALSDFREKWLVTGGEESGISPLAEAYFASCALRHPDAAVIYADDDLPEAGGGSGRIPRFKPDFNLTYLRAWNYIGSCFAVKRELLLQMGYGDAVSGLTPAGAYEILLRAAELSLPICHIPEVLSRPETDGACEPADGIRLLKEHYARCGVPADVVYDADYGIYRTNFLTDRKPLISVLIPNRDHAEDLRRCVRSAAETGGWDQLEFLILENGSREEETFRCYRELEETCGRVRILKWDGDFNYAAINNFGAEAAEGEYLLFLNNDTQMLPGGAVRRMAEACMQEGTGAVGARMYFADDTIQHAGVIIGYAGFAGHCFSGEARGAAGYMKRIVSQMELSAVTAACMMCPAEAFRQVGGFSPELAVALNDIDLCLKLKAAGYRIFYEPGAELYHFESKSRGYEDSPAKKERFEREKGIFRERWAEYLEAGDPAYNPNLTLDRPNFSLRR